MSIFSREPPLYIYIQSRVWIYDTRRLHVCERGYHKFVYVFYTRAHVTFCSANTETEDHSVPPNHSGTFYSVSVTLVVVELAATLPGALIAGP